MGFSIESGRNDNRLHFEIDGSTIDKGRDKKADGIKGWEANKCSSLWKWFCKDVMGWVVEVNIGKKSYLVGTKSAIHFIDRNKIAVPTDGKSNDKFLSARLIKNALETFANAKEKLNPSANPAPKPTVASPAKPTPALHSVAIDPSPAKQVEPRSLEGWKKQLESFGTITHDWLLGNGFQQSKSTPTVYSISVDNLTELMKRAPASLPLDMAAQEALRASNPAQAAAAIADDGMQLVPASPQKEGRVAAASGHAVVNVNAEVQFGPASLREPRTQQQWVNMFASAIALDLRDLIQPGEFFRQSGDKLILIDHKEFANAAIAEFNKLTPKEQLQHLESYYKKGANVRGFLPEVDKALQEIMPPQQQRGAVAGLLMPPSAKKPKEGSLQERHPGSLSAVLERLREKGLIGSKPAAPAPRHEPAAARAPKPPLSPVREKAPAAAQKESAAAPAAHEEAAVQQPTWLAEGTPAGLKADLTQFKAAAEKLTPRGFDISKGDDFYHLALGIAQGSSKTPFQYQKSKAASIKQEINTAVADLHKLPILQHFWVVDLLNQPKMTNQATRDQMITEFNTRCKTASINERAQMAQYIDKERSKAPTFYAKIQIG